MQNNITVIKKIRIGSTSFFESFNDFKSKDIDELCIISKPINGKETSFCIKLNGKDLILYPQLSKEQFIKNDLNINDPIKIGKYLSKEFIDYIHLTIDDLKLLKPLYNKIKDTHKYQQIIYDAYIENNNFTLSKEQLIKAYKEYKKYR